jgi:proteic killer suppression protein
VIVSFRNKGLQELFESGRSRSIRSDLQKRCLLRLDSLELAGSLKELSVPAYRLHPLLGASPTRHAIKVNGPWRLTFEWTEDGPANVDLEQYH